MPLVPIGAHHLPEWLGPAEEQISDSRFLGAVCMCKPNIGIKGKEQLLTKCWTLSRQRQLVKGQEAHKDTTACAPLSPGQISLSLPASQAGAGYSQEFLQPTTTSCHLLLCSPPLSGCSLSQAPSLFCTVHSHGPSHFLLCPCLSLYLCFL